MQALPKRGYFGRSKASEGRVTGDMGRVQVKSGCQSLRNFFLRKYMAELFITTRPLSFLVMLLHFFRFSVGLEIRAIAAMVFSMKNKTAFQAGTGNSCNKQERDIFSEQAHGRALIKYTKKEGFIFVIQTRLIPFSCIFTR